jgi:uroporphyrinogen-III decarboxylase
MIEPKKNDLGKSFAFHQPAQLKYDAETEYTCHFYPTSHRGGKMMARQMTPQERMRTLFTGEKPDRVPVNPFVLGYAAQITGVSIGDLYADGDKWFEAQFAAMRLHGYEATPFYAYASCGPWEFGGRIEFPYREGSSAPYVLQHPVNRIGDIENLEVPDFKRNPMRNVSNCAKRT